MIKVMFRLSTNKKKAKFELYTNSVYSGMSEFEVSPFRVRPASCSSHYTEHLGKHLDYSNS